MGKNTAHTPEGPPSWFGKYREVGKTEARQVFLRLLDDLQDEEVSLAITDRGERVAVIMGFKFYESLLASLQQSRSAAGNPLAGTIETLGDLETNKGKVNALFEEARKKSKKSV